MSGKIEAYENQNEQYKVMKKEFSIEFRLHLHILGIF